MTGVAPVCNNVTGVAPVCNNVTGDDPVCNNVTGDAFGRVSILLFGSCNMMMTRLAYAACAHISHVRTFYTCIHTRFMHMPIPHPHAGAARPIQTASVQGYRCAGMYAAHATLFEIARTCMHAYIHMCIHTRRYVCFARDSVQDSSYMHAYIHACTRTCRHRVYMLRTRALSEIPRTCIHIYMHTYIHAYI